MPRFLYGTGISQAPSQCPSGTVSSANAVTSSSSIPPATKAPAEPYPTPMVSNLAGLSCNEGVGFTLSRTQDSASGLFPYFLCPQENCTFVFQDNNSLQEHLQLHDAIEVPEIKNSDTWMYADMCREYC